MTTIWTTQTADSKFSNVILTRDKKCQRCKFKVATDNSHYYERHHSSVRFSGLNCVGLCRECHNFFHSNRPEYKNFMIRRLGLDAFLVLQRTSAMTMKRERAILRLMASLKEFEPCSMGLCDGSGKVLQDNDEVKCPHIN